LIFQAKFFFDPRSEQYVKEETMYPEVKVKVKSEPRREDSQTLEVSENGDVLTVMDSLKYYNPPLNDPEVTMRISGPSLRKKIKKTKAPLIIKQERGVIKLKDIKTGLYIKDLKKTMSAKAKKQNEKQLPEMDKKHPCVACSMSFSKLFELAEHNYIHHRSEDIYQCPTCSYSNELSKHLKRHIKKVHLGIRHPCPKCPKMILETNLKQHLANMHSGIVDKKFKCSFDGCDFKTHNYTSVYSHERQKHMQETHKYRCDRCDKTYAFPHGLKLHVESTHLGIRRYVCEKCGKGYQNKKMLDDHLAKPSCTFSPSTLYKCDQCTSEFIKVHGFIKHYDQQHGGFPPNLKTGPVHLCDSCPKIFLNPASLDKHRKHEHEGVPKVKKDRGPRMQCPHCDKRLLKGNNMEEHIRSKHEGNTPHECDECNRSFGTYGSLRAHKYNMHKRVKCDLCGQSLCNTFWLKRHKASAHGITPTGSHQCEYCPLFFNSPGYKENHIKKQHAEVNR
jgi:hypothetical protein